tara:strand:- start:349 stop:501 length:153 start_codon:yes stop_codon:yes gene_type:complete
MKKIGLSNEIVFLRHFKIIEEEKFFQIKDVTALKISVKKNLPLKLSQRFS